MRPFFYLSSKHPFSLCISFHSIPTPTLCPRFPAYLFYRYNSTAPVLEPFNSHVPKQTRKINVRNVTAPHLGHIRILSLNSPENRNALSWRLLKELRQEIGLIHSDLRSRPGIAALGPPLGAEEGEILHRGNVMQKVKKNPNVSDRDESGKVEADNDQVKNEENNEGMVAEGPPRVLILASEVDGIFCAGADLKERKNMTKEETDHFLSTLRSTFRAISELPIPTISAVASVALGGGFELALATHLRIFANSARVGLPETLLGIIPGAGGTYRLRGLIGESRALEMILTGRIITGSDTYRMGICERFVETDSENTANGVTVETVLLDKALKFATDICNAGPLAVTGALAAVKGGTAQQENTEYGRVLLSADRDEGLRAFAEKRKPIFKGSMGGLGSLSNVGKPKAIRELTLRYAEKPKKTDQPTWRHAERNQRTVDYTERPRFSPRGTVRKVFDSKFDAAAAHLKTLGTEPGPTAQQTVTSIDSNFWEPITDPKKPRPLSPRETSQGNTHQEMLNPDLQLEGKLSTSTPVSRKYGGSTKNFPTMEHSSLYIAQPKITSNGSEAPQPSNLNIAKPRTTSNDPETPQNSGLNESSQENTRPELLNPDLPLVRKAVFDAPILRKVAIAFRKVALVGRKVTARESMMGKDGGRTRNFPITEPSSLKIAKPKTTPNVPETLQPSSRRESHRKKGSLSIRRLDNLSIQRLSARKLDTLPIRKLGSSKRMVRIITGNPRRLLSKKGNLYNGVYRVGRRAEAQ